MILGQIYGMTYDNLKINLKVLCELGPGEGEPATLQVNLLITMMMMMKILQLTHSLDPDNSGRPVLMWTLLKGNNNW